MVCSSLCLSVWHVHCIVLKRQTISTRFLLLMSAPMSLPDRVKIWFTSVDPFFPKFYPKVTHPVDLGVRDIRQQIVAEWLEIAHWSQWYHHWPLYTTSPSSKMKVVMHTSDVVFRQITLALVNNNSSRTCRVAIRIDSFNDSIQINSFCKKKIGLSIL